MRQFLRHPTDIPIAYRLGRGLAGQSRPLRNVGHGGLCFVSTLAIAPGAEIQIEIEVAEPTFRAEGLVVWCRPSPGDGDYEVGVRFDGVETEYAVRMVEQVCQIEHYRREVERCEGRTLGSQEAAMEWIERYAARFPH
jgi:hypothetical protein